MSDVITFLLAVVTFAFVAYPLLTRRPSSLPSSADDHLQELYSKRNTTYSMLKELEFDYDSGILTDEDYRELESRYKNKAVSILKGIDQRLASADDIDMDIEKQVRNRRRGKKPAASLDNEIERQIRNLRRSGKPAAGAVAGAEKDVRELREGGKMSGADVGAPVEAREPRASRGPFCSQCGEKSRDGDRFCAHCGTRLD